MPGQRSWKDKLLDDKDLPRVEPLPEKLVNRWGPGTVVIPAPREVDELMRRVPPGRVTTINEIRAALARKHRATVGCPMTTGIFACIAARAAEEDRAAGVPDITPYWRTLKSGGVLNEKYPGGLERAKAFLEQEGHTVIRRGKHYVVANLDAVLFAP